MNQQGPARTIHDLVFAGFNNRVIALDRFSGELIWQWRPTQGRGFVSLLVDGDRLIVGVSGYMYCLDPLFGQEVWSNPLKGLGVGITSLASVNGSSDISVATAAIEAQRQQQAAASSSAVH